MVIDASADAGHAGCLSVAIKEWLTPDIFDPGVGGVESRSICSARQFSVRDCRRGVEQLSIKDFTAERVLKFLETDRHDGIATRNARLGLSKCSRGSSHQSGRNISPPYNV